MIAKVIVDIASSKVDKVFDYLCPFFVSVGDEVLVPFGSRKMKGLVTDIVEQSEVNENKLKPILKKLENGVDKKTIELAKFISTNYYVGMADALRLFLPRLITAEKTKSKLGFVVELDDRKKAETYLKTLNNKSKVQREIINFMLKHNSCAWDMISKNFGSSSINSLINNGILSKKTCILRRAPKVDIIDNQSKILNKQQNLAVSTILSKTDFYLLHGVTGSGKTEVYLSVAQEMINNGKSVLILVPEISLTPQMLGLVKSRFKDSVAVLHSGLTNGERFDEWKKIQSGMVNLVIGARSAIFAPIKNLGLIVVDEEHDDSYRSDTNPRYDTRIVAEKLAELENCSLILGSATPSLESYTKALSGYYKLIEMPERVNNKKMPTIEIVDMTKEFQRGNTGVLSHALEEEIKKALDRNEQVMLFINRRGYNSFLQCKNCGWVANCPDCDVSLVYHKAENVLKCHFCGNRYKMFSVCPECQNENLMVSNFGTQKIVEEVQQKFANAKVIRMDNDTTRTKNAHAKILSSFRNKEANVLVGTQMIAKGHDFPLVSLVGIIDADISLHQTSYKAAEKTFSLITQVAGRAGRSLVPGKVILQTRSPNHYCFKFAKNYDYISFFKKESNLREVTKYPPFAKILRILVKSFDQEVAKNAVMSYYKKIKDLQTENKQDFFYLGIMKSPVGRIEKQYRFQVLIRISDSSKLVPQIYDIVKTNQPKNAVVFVEINPTNLS